MLLHTEWVEHESPRGNINSYLAHPAAPGMPVPGIIVVQEVWGVDQHIRDVTDRFATAGYAALAPDLYSAGGGRPDELSFDRVEKAKTFLSSLPPDQWMSVLSDEDSRSRACAELPGDEGPKVSETLGALFGAGPRDSGDHVAALKSAVEFLRAHQCSVGKPVGSVGYCMGGALSALLACSNAAISGAVIYYGSSPGSDEVAKLTCPVRGFYGADDPRVVSTLPAFSASLSARGVDAELRIYPETPHAFFNDTRPTYRPAPARDAWARTLEFFANVLDPAATIGPEQLG